MIDWTSLPNDVVAAGVIAALGLVLRHLNSRYAPKIDMFKSVAANATKITSRILLPILFSIVGLWFCIHMLLDAVHDPAPVTRVAVLDPGRRTVRGGDQVVAKALVTGRVGAAGALLRVLRPVMRRSAGVRCARSS